MADDQSLRTLITIDGERYLLASTEDVDALRAHIEEAVQDGGRFVDIAAEGSSLSVLITPRSTITVVRVAASHVDDEPPGVGLPDF